VNEVEIYVAGMMGTVRRRPLKSQEKVFLFSLPCLAPEEEILRKALLCFCSFRQKLTHWGCRQKRI